jgi:hypothetical protein
LSPTVSRSGSRINIRLSPAFVQIVSRQISAWPERFTNLDFRVQPIGSVPCLGL